MKKRQWYVTKKTDISNKDRSKYEQRKAHEHFTNTKLIIHNSFTNIEMVKMCTQDKT